MSKRKEQETATVAEKVSPSSKWEELAEHAEADTENTAEEALLEQPSYDELTARLSEMENKAEEHWQKFLRAQADMDNLRRRLEKDLANAHKFALEGFVNNLLPVVGSLERSLDVNKSTEGGLKAIHEGVALTLKMFMDVLSKFSVQTIDPQGQPFDPEQHEAMSTQPSDELPPNTVVNVLQKGYSLNGRLIRPALVIVSSKNSS